MTHILVCPFCLTIFVNSCTEGDECSCCGVGNLLDYDDYKLRLSSSFLWELSMEHNDDDQ